MAEVWREQGLMFDDMPDGSFRLTVPVSVVEPNKRRQSGRDDVRPAPVLAYRA